MKYFLFAIMLLLGLHADAQSFDISKVEFRVYDVQGTKIGLGKIKAVSDTSMHFKPFSRQKREIPFQEIGTIKTSLTKGKGILIGAATGAGLGALIAGTTTNKFDLFASVISGDSGSKSYKGAKVFLGAVLGGAIGAGIGLIVDESNKYTYHIRGDRDDWDSFKSKLTGFPPEESSSVNIDKPDDRIEANSPSIDSINQRDLFTNQDWRVFETGTFNDLTR